MKPKSMVVKDSKLASNEVWDIVGGRSEEKTYDGGELQEIIITPNKMM